VVLGEYGTWRRTPETNTRNPKDMPMHNRPVDYWLTFSTKTRRANGILLFWWEVGNGFDRKNNVVNDQRMVNALLQDISKI
jgi:hypothetical protein